MKAVTAAEMLQAETAWFDSGAITLPQLMDRVGRLIADWVIEHVDRHVALTNVALLAGSGNNGGDAIVAATYLARAGANAAIILALPRSADDELLRAASEAGANVVAAHEPASARAVAEICARADITVDGVFGFSISRPIDDRLGRLFAAVRAASRRIVAIDLPSGADPDTGDFDPKGLPADHTLSVGLPKIGTAVRFGQPEFGSCHSVLDVDMPPKITAHLRREVLSDRIAADLLPARSMTAHKGSLGRTLLVVGSPSFIGAAVLAASAGARSSVGLLAVATLPALKPTIAARVPEATFVDLPATDDGDLDPDGSFDRLADAIAVADSVLLGSGFGISESRERLLARLLCTPDLWPRKNVVVDADALTMLAGKDIWQRLGGNVVVTPHPGEAARMLGNTIAQVQADRLAAAEALASLVGGTAVLKGASTLIARDDGAVRINMRPNSALARGGTGDVLAGIIAGLAAQLAPFDAASLGVYLHATAAQIAAARHGVYGCTASDVVAQMPAAFRRIASDA